ncbi:MAG: PglZ domain-containing protein [Acidimicrobiales bacterium]|nr:PglZ domain-containing protein [Acidimicrobiales bacterium]
MRSQLEPTLPAFSGGCITNLLPYLLPRGRGMARLPVELGATKKRVLLVLDGVGWDQLQDRQSIVPTLHAMTGGPITTVAPSTTATALTSITTSLTPAEHGVVGYRMVVDGEVLNTLRWGSLETPDARRQIPPDVIQPYDPFHGQDVPLVSRADFRRSGFSAAHLRGAHLVGYRTTATLVHEVSRLLHEGEEFVYAYYDGIDKVSHEYGFGSVFDAEFAFVDRLVAEIIASVPSGTEVIVTADHGQVDCGNNVVHLHEDVDALVTGMSGEGRFRWLHCDPAAIDELESEAKHHHGHQAWVRTRQQILDENWFGPVMRHGVEDRLGDVALCPFEPISFFDPADSGPYELIGRHGSLTDAEMLVPLLRAEA